MNRLKTAMKTDDDNIIKLLFLSYPLKRIYRLYTALPISLLYLQSQKLRLRLRSCTRREGPLLLHVITRNCTFYNYVIVVMKKCCLFYPRPRVCQVAHCRLNQKIWRPNDRPITVKRRFPIAAHDSVAMPPAIKIPPLFSYAPIIVAGRVNMHAYSHTHNFSSLMITARKHLSRNSKPKIALAMSLNPALPPQGRQLPFAAVSRHCVIIKARTLGRSHPPSQKRFSTLAILAVIKEIREWFWSLIFLFWFYSNNMGIRNLLPKFYKE
jgi:hypothetical protein